MGTDNSSADNILFIKLPTNDTVTLRNLPCTLSLRTLGARLELIASLPLYCFQLWYGDRMLSLTDTIKFGEAGDVRNGSLVKLKLFPQYENLYQCLSENNIDGFLRGEGVEKGPENEEEDNEKEHRIVMVMCASCRTGNVKLLKQISLQTKVNVYRTPLGRSLLHLAAANNQVSIVGYLLKSHAFSIFDEDTFRQTCMDIAVEYSARSVEKYCRDFLLRRLDEQKGKKDGSVKDKNVKVRKCWSAGKPKQHVAQSNRGVNSPSTSNDKLTHQPVPTMVVTSPRYKARMVEVYDDKQGIVYKRLKRTKSAPPKSQIAFSTKPQNLSDHIEPKAEVRKTLHNPCIKNRPFMALPTVTPEERRPVSMEYVPLDTRPSVQTQQASSQDGLKDNSRLTSTNDFNIPSAPCSSLNNSREDLSVSSSDEESIMSPQQVVLRHRKYLDKKYSNVKSITYRTQSAKYYRTQYHLEAQQDQLVTKARPKTADCRYRSWKVWMTDKLQRDEEKVLLEQDKTEQRRRNIRAFEKWLARKNKQSWSSYCLTDSEDSQTGGCDLENEKAYKGWVANKRKTGALAKLDARYKQELLSKLVTTKEPDIYEDKKLHTMFVIGCTDPTPIIREHPDHNMRSFQTWKANKQRFDKWRQHTKNHDARSDRAASAYDVYHTRGALVMNGMTYEEWLGQKDRERRYLTPHKP